ncbi:MAG: Manganese and iron superoxide dismutase [Candidatus Nomurabacteria bacterium GW2011_GWB1_40_7]|uniref:superoxide dismutase n=1 Tax=Candidatus Nomurabacteria bacterium GW2011_GWB1_40_7 TaxID=1618744 RepID=A0A0G0T082_9BACT|nr:MAG: Manganese and iron superoxide dismutase [Candidatus Nomurabacteria bacterium GW2011_GWB1_40_7]
MKFEEIKFNIGALNGISARNVEEHLKLYAGYVKNTNLILEKIPEYEGYTKEDAFAPYVVSEIQRRFGFEFNGMRNHEYFFKSLEGGTKSLPENSAFKKEIEKDLPFDKWLDIFKSLAMTRGVGWAVLYWDKQTKQFVATWVDEHHMGQLNGLNWILGIDMWEHAFVYDYSTSEKKKYVDAFFENLNWEVIEESFKNAQ